jgi:mono/diheme cytochrome c family protein
MAASIGTAGEVTVKLNLIAGALVAFGLALPAAAQPAGDPAAGHELANRWCASCHIVGSEQVGKDVAPPFRAIEVD